MARERIVSRREWELSITCEDRPGTLAQVARLLGAAKVNILATSCTTSGVQGAVRVIVDDVARAKKFLIASIFLIPSTKCSMWSCRIARSPGQIRRQTGGTEYKRDHGIRVCDKGKQEGNHRLQGVRPGQSREHLVGGEPHGSPARVFSPDGPLIAAPLYSFREFRARSSGAAAPLLGLRRLSPHAGAHRAQLACGA